MHDPSHDSQPDPFEKKVRFGCGFLLGIVIGLAEVTRHAYEQTGGVSFAVIASLGVLCGVLAMKYGDRFWHRISRVRWWW